MAEKNQRQNTRNIKQTNESGINITLIFGIIFLLSLGYLTLKKFLPIWILGWYIVINLATFLFYAHDKNAAQNGGWRVQESSLHKLSLLGGWFGAGVAHKMVRHKSQKTEFRQGFYLTIIGNLILLGVFWYFNLR